MANEPYSKSVKDFENELSTSKIGLSSENAKERLIKYGPNSLTEVETVGPWMMFLLQFKDFLMVLLLGAALASFIFSEYVEALIIVIIVILNAVLGFTQEYRAEQSLEKLKELTGDDTLVIRDGKETRVDTRNLVPGDVLLLYEGETIAADARIFEANRLRVEEGILTGESVPVDKTTDTIEGEFIPLGDRTNLAFAGTTTVKGRGKALIYGTAMNTEMGKIAQSTMDSEEQDTPLQEQLSTLGKFLGIIVIAVCAFVFITQLPKVNAGDIELFEVIEIAIALAVSAVPEGLAAAITLTLAIGVQQMAKKKAIIRKLPAVETLGSVEVICTDKTGTLTMNKMTAQRVWTPDLGDVEVTGTGYVPKGNFIHKEKTHKIFTRLDKEKKLDIKKRVDLYRTVKAGALCCTAKIQFDSKKNEWICEGDPTEGSLVVLAMKANLYSRWEEGYSTVPNGEIFFDSDRKRMSMIYERKRPAKKDIYAFMKGSPQSVLECCTHILIDDNTVPLTGELKQQILEKNSELASQAFRVLGVAQRILPKNMVEYTEASVEKEMIFLGLVGQVDPPRQEVQAAVAKCKNAGIRIIMITGDQIDTAMAIAKSLDLKPYEDKVYTAYTSAELEQMTDEKFIEVVKDLDVCARASPSIKKRIVKSLQDDYNQVVAMTGDGVNDAPALKRADIGIAMGITGTDVAREASDMVLMDDNFSTIVSAVEEGRKIYDNMKKFIRYLLSSNFDEILVVFTATVLLGLPSPYLALGILWINLLTDGLPALALSIDPGDAEIMKRKPRGKQSGMLKDILLFSLIAGIISFTATMIVFTITYVPGVSDATADLEKARTLALTVSVLFELFQVFVSRAPDGRSFLQTNPINNIYLLFAVGSAFILHLFIIYVEPLAQIFGMTIITLPEWGLMLIIVIVGVILLDFFKLLQVKFFSSDVTSNIVPS